jgi:hypothetical protein
MPPGDPGGFMPIRSRKDLSPIRSKPTRKNQDEEDDQDDADDTNAAVTIPITVAAEAATEATKQEDDKNDDEYESKRRHDLSPIPGSVHVASFEFLLPAMCPLLPIASLPHRSNSTAVGR